MPARKRPYLDQRYAELLRRDQWIIDGFGGTRAAWERFSAAKGGNLVRVFARLPAQRDACCEVQPEGA